MSALHVSRYILVCDGCAATHGEPHGHSSAMEMRAAAYASGWRFPSQVRKNGTAASRASDVCPTCLPSWTPHTPEQRRESRRAGLGSET